MKERARRGWKEEILLKVWCTYNTNHQGGSERTEQVRSTVKDGSQSVQMEMEMENVLA